MSRFIIILFFAFSTHSALASTTEAKLNIAISNIASAIEDISDAKGAVIKVQVDKGISKGLAEDAMESMATVIGVRSVGMFPISEMLELQTGTKQRFYKAYRPKKGTVPF